MKLLSAWNWPATNAALFLAGAAVHAYAGNTSTAVAGLGAAFGWAGWAFSRARRLEADRRAVELAGRWEADARRAFADAGNEENPMGRRLIEHGAMCYVNCALDLREALPPARTNDGLAVAPTSHGTTDEV